MKDRWDERAPEPYKYERRPERETIPPPGQAIPCDRSSRYGGSSYREEEIHYPPKQPYHQSQYPSKPPGTEYPRRSMSQSPEPGYNPNSRPQDRRPHPPYQGDPPHHYAPSRYDYERQWDGVPSFPPRRKPVEDRENVIR